MRITIPTAVVFAVFAAACTAPARTSEDASPAPGAAQTAGEKAKEGAEKVGEAAKDLAQEAKEKGGPAAHEAAEKAKEAGHEAGKFLDAEKAQIEVKTALMADKTVDASDIDVSSSPGTKTITLKGSVPTAAQKTAAERIANDKADGYTIRNLLTVDAAPAKH